VRTLRLILSDFLGLARVCGWPVAFRWLFAIATHLNQCRARKNLAPADEVFGDGPFPVYQNGQPIWLIGNSVLTGIREVWVRNSYFKGAPITISDNAQILDLGAGTGGFTLQAMMRAKNSRAIAIESEASRCDRMIEVFKLNNTTGRVKIVNAFAGSAPPDATAPTLSESQLCQLVGPNPIDLLKCDIEGSELTLFGNPSPLLARTRQLVMELHPHAGDIQPLIASIQSQGFKTILKPQGPAFMLWATRK
jgi:hypothetical protein